MSDAISLLKANYCRSIMRTASIGSDIEARRLIDGLTTETATPGTTAEVAEAEKQALLAIHALAEHIHGQGARVTGVEWTKASLAIDRWVEAASYAQRTAGKPRH